MTSNSFSEDSHKGFVIGFHKTHPQFILLRKKGDPFLYDTYTWHEIELGEEYIEEASHEIRESSDELGSGKKGLWQKLAGSQKTSYRNDPKLPRF